MGLITYQVIHKTNRQTCVSKFPLSTFLQSEEIYTLHLSEAINFPCLAYSDNLTHKWSYSIYNLTGIQE